MISYGHCLGSLCSFSWNIVYQFSLHFYQMESSLHFLGVEFSYIVDSLFKVQRTENLQLVADATH
jgi:hypothetical protein